jgi:hypothetical protein
VQPAAGNSSISSSGSGSRSGKGGGQGGAVTDGGGGTTDCDDDVTANGGTANGDAAGMVAAAIRTACAEAAVRQVRYLYTYPHYYTYYTPLLAHYCTIITLLLLLCTIKMAAMGQALVSPRSYMQMQQLGCSSY